MTKIVKAEAHLLSAIQSAMDILSPGFDNDDGPYDTAYRVLEKAYNEYYSDKLSALDRTAKLI